jgi:hypothetical protein
MSDHVVLWYDPERCRQIMDAVEAINDVNSTGYNPKLTFRFFIDESETLYDEMTIKECGFRWIYQEEEEVEEEEEEESEEEEEESSEEEETFEYLYIKYQELYRKYSLPPLNI